jgi:dihydrofolate reductase
LTLSFARIIAIIRKKRYGGSMRKIIASEFLTLDGIMESSEQWQPAYYCDEMGEAIQAQILGSDVMLLGRVTYEIFAAYWPSLTNNEFGIADKLNSMPKFVVSSTLQKAEWNNSLLIKEHVVEAISELKQQPGGNIGITGSATLVHVLMQANLIDEYRLMVHPLMLGSGKRLFQDGSKANLKLLETRAFSSGVVLLRYQSVAKGGEE